MDGEVVTISGFLVQALATLFIANITILTGYVFAWPSYNVANFVSNTTILSAPMSSVEVSLLGSLANIGALLATPLCTYLLNSLGRKYTCMLFGLPYVFCWIIITYTKSVTVVIAAMGLAGMGAAGQAASSVYISEIAQDAIRGALTSSVVSGLFLGLLLSYSWGGYLSYEQVVYVHLTLSILYILLVGLLKESPVFLMKSGKEKEAARSLAFYRRVSVTSKEVEVALAKIKLQLDPALETRLEGGKDPGVTDALVEGKAEEKRAVSEWQFLKNSQSSKRGLKVAIIVMAYTVLMGVIVMQVYAEPLFKEAVPSMESNQCSIILAIVFIIASLLCGVLVDKLGRKYLMIGTTFAAGVCILLLGTQLQFHWAPNYVSAIFIYGFCFFYNLGPAPIPFVIAAEFFLPEVRGLCSNLVNACAWIMNFITLTIFSIMVEVFGLAPLFYIFAASSAFGVVYCLFYLPETKGLSVDAIQLLFIKERRRDAK
ncbi:facilitated trehalose transporter Tret1 isoform X1 [Manduca sexta]|uniref:facilitated trehalose transporter Tret1 isoform X1 n=2 Tax=Manduca sexta TaxID=7130 RepID=UPI00188DCAB5|nr:facilitated trehalose transporter Tret1 isoform X1 [Manduca sexta]